MDDRSLVLGLRSGDESAVVEFVRQFQGTVRRYVALRAPSPSEADDLAQEAFLVALRRADQFDPERGDLKSWLLGISRNLARQAWRRVRKQARGYGLSDACEASPLDLALEDKALDLHEAEQRAGGACLRLEAVSTCIQNLPAKPQRLFRRLILDQEPIEALAREWRTTEATLRAFISRTRKSLRDCVERRLAGAERHG